MQRQTKLLIVLAVVGVLFMLSKTKAGAGAVDAVTDKLASLLHREEGERLTVYQDTAGKWTVGKGHLIVASDGLWPYADKRTITQEESDAFFARDTAAARSAVARSVKVPLSVNQLAALSSLAFNIGGAAFAASTLVRLLNSGDKAGAADQFLAWNKITKNGAKITSAGLTSRRQRERALFLTA